MRIKPILQLGLMAILLLSPSLIASNRPVFWMLWACVVFLLLSLKNLQPPSKDQIHFGPLPALVAILAATILLQSFGFIGETPRASLLAFIRLLTYAGFFWLIASSSKAQRQQLLPVIVASVTVYALYGIATKNGILPMPEALKTSQYADSITSSFINRNAFALYVGMGMQVCLLLIFENNHVKNTLGFLAPKSTVLLLVFGLLFITLILTNSRMGFGAAMLGCAVFLMLALKNNRAVTGVAFGGILFCIMIFMLYNKGLSLRYLTVSHDIYVRLQLYTQVWQMVLIQPITGFGADSFQVAFPQFQHLPLDPTLTWDKAHNSYLTNWVELGLIAGSVPLIMSLYVAKKIWPHARNIPLIACAIGVLVQNALHSSVDFGLEIQANVFLFLTILGLAFAKADDQHRP